VTGREVKKNISNPLKRAVLPQQGGKKYGNFPVPSGGPGPEGQPNGRLTKKSCDKESVERRGVGGVQTVYYARQKNWAET